MSTELEHERTVEREFGPDTGLARRRLLGTLLIAMVLGFLAMILALYGNDDPRSFYGNIYDESDPEPSLPWFVIKAAGLATLALVVPWLATRRSARDPDAG